MKRIFGLFLLLFLAGFCFAKNSNTITVNVAKPIAKIQPTMWGIFFEDINMAADGGIYAELVKNRSFEFAQPLMGWKILKPDTTSGILFLNQSATNPNNPRYARITIDDGEPSFGLSNGGFRGMGIKKGIDYHFSVMARQLEGSSLKMHVELVDSKGKQIGSANLTPVAKDWQKYMVSFTANETDPKSKLNIWFEGKGSLDIDMISLFPDDTWKHRPGGLRADLVQLLADLKPGFLRFPGGCIVEGRELATRYQWKKTVGDVNERQVIVNRWNTEFKHRLTPDYFQSFGLGFFEYFQLAEDIGAQPLPILNCGMACQYNSAEAVPTDELDPYIQDALDLIEFANGSLETKWGKLRAEMGHPIPFNLKMMGVGNENWGIQYIERLKIFSKAIKDKHPDIKLINSSGTDPNGERFDYLNGELRKMNADIIDEHYYRSPDWFLANARRYDSYPRTGSKVFAGEYAAQSDKTVSVDNRNNWKCALSEAAFMTGLERNAAVIAMASYAPLFAHIDAWQWTPDLIWFDNLRAYGTPNYYVQKLFSNHKGTQVIPITLNNEAVAGQDSLYASACWDKKSNELIIKLINASSKKKLPEISVEGVKKLNQSGSEIVLQSNNLSTTNSLDNPVFLSPKEEKIVVKGKVIKPELLPYSFTVIRVGL